MLKPKVGKIFANRNMAKDIVGNYIRTNRRIRGLSQRELGNLVGYGYGHAAVGRHERSKSVPPLLIALAYEIVFEIPVAQLFPGFRSVVTQSVTRNMQELKADLERQSGNQRRPNLEKTQWLSKQRS